MLIHHRALWKGITVKMAGGWHTYQPGGWVGGWVSGKPFLMVLFLSSRKTVTSELPDRFVHFWIFEWLFVYHSWVFCCRKLERRIQDRLPTWLSCKRTTQRERNSEKKLKNKTCFKTDFKIGFMSPPYYLSYIISLPEKEFYCPANKSRKSQY